MRSDFRAIPSAFCAGFVAAATIFAACADGQSSSLPPPNIPANSNLSSATSIIVREFRFRSNTVFTSAALAQVVAPFLNRTINSSDLEEARSALSQFYVNAGYINSGAILEDQPLQDGIVTFTVVEGRLSGIHVSGNKHLRSWYVQDRLEEQAGPPLNINAIRDELLDLKNNPNILRINAELKPGEIPGTSYLDVSVTEAPMAHASLQMANDRPTTVGAEDLQMSISVVDLLGFGDALDFRDIPVERTSDGAKFSASDNFGGDYTVPISVHDGTLQVFYNESDYAVIQQPFLALGVTSRSENWGLTLREPIYKTPHQEVALGVTAEQRQSATSLLGEPFEFSTEAPGGIERVSALRFFQEWIMHRPTDAFTLRSTVNWGVNGLGATINGTPRDGRFVSWQGQAQYVRRLGDTPLQLLLGATGQWSPDPLLYLEQLSLGGMNTVPGYRENLELSDLGIIGHLELRAPIWTSPTGGNYVTLAPFAAYGKGWNADSTPNPPDLPSAGLGLLLNPCKPVAARIYWGYAFRDFHLHGDPQDFGLHFVVNVSLF
jgi:hemolysin activation/secretion protein